MREPADQRPDEADLERPDDVLAVRTPRKHEQRTPRRSRSTGPTPARRMTMRSRTAAVRCRSTTRAADTAQYVRSPTMRHSTRYTRIGSVDQCSLCGRNRSSKLATLPIGEEVPFVEEEPLLCLRARDRAGARRRPRRRTPIRQQSPADCGRGHARRHAPVPRNRDEAVRQLVFVSRRALPMSRNERHDEAGADCSGRSHRHATLTSSRGRRLGETWWDRRARRSVARMPDCGGLGDA